MVAEKNSFGVSGMNFKAWVRRVQIVGEAGAASTENVGEAGVYLFIIIGPIYS